MLVAVVATASPLVWLYQKVQSGEVERQLEAVLHRALGSPVHIGAVGMDWAGVVFASSISVGPGQAGEPTFQLDRISVHYSYWKLLTGRLVLDRLRLEGPRIRVARLPDGTTTLQPILDHLAKRKKLPSSPGADPQGKKRFDLSSPPHSLPIERIEVVGLSLDLEDRKVSPAAAVAIRNASATVALPGPDRPLELSLAGEYQQGKASLEAELFLNPVFGKLSFALEGVPISTLDGYLRKARLPLQVPEVDMKVRGEVEASPGVLSSDPQGQLHFDRKAVSYTLHLDVPSIRLSIPEPTLDHDLQISSSVQVDVGPEWLSIEKLALDLPGGAHVDVVGRVDGFSSPLLDLSVDVRDLDFEEARSSLPRSRLPTRALEVLDQLKPSGSLQASVQIAGRLDRLAVSGRTSLKDAAVSHPLLGELKLQVPALSFTRDSVQLGGASLSVLGAEAALDLCLERIQSAPRGELKASLRHAEPAQWPLPPRIRSLIAGGSLDVEVSLQASLEHFLALNGLQNPRSLTTLRNPRGFEGLRRFIQEVSNEVHRVRRIASKVRPSDLLRPAVQDGKVLSPRERLDTEAWGRLTEDLALHRFRVLAFERLPVVLSELAELFSAGASVAADLNGVALKVPGQRRPGGLPVGVSGRISLDLDEGLVARDLMFAVDGHPVGLDLQVLRPLVAPRIEFAAALPAPGSGRVDMRLQDLVESLPAPRREALARLGVQGRLSAGLSASLDRAESSLAGDLHLREVQAANGSPRTRLKDLKVSLKEGTLELAPTVLEVGPAQVELACSAGLDRKVHAFIRTVTGGGVPVAELLEAAGGKVPERVPQGLIEALRLGLGLEVEGTLPELRATLQFGLRHPAARFSTAARGADLLGRPAATGRTRLEVPSLSRLLLAVKPAGSVSPDLVQRLDKAGLDLEFRTGFSLERGGRSTGTLSFPGGSTRFQASLPAPASTGPLRYWAQTDIDRLHEITSLLPPPVQEKIASLRPSLAVALDLQATRTHDGVIQIRHSATFPRATLGIPLKSQELADQVLHVDATGSQASLRARLRPRVPSEPGQLPFELSALADLSGMKALIEVAGHELRARAQGGLQLSLERIASRELGLELDGNRITCDVDVKDPLGERRTSLKVALDDWDLTKLTRRFIPDALQTWVDGTVRFEATADGRPPFMVPGGRLTLSDIVVHSPKLKSVPLGLPRVDVRFTHDDVLIDAFDVHFGVKKFHMPILGSMKEVLHAENVYRVPPETIGPLVLSHMGGLNRIKNLLGEFQLQQLIIDQLLKVKITLKARDYPGTFEFKGVLPPDQARRFLTDPQSIIDEQTILAKQALAERMGFLKSTHGKENYKMVVFTYEKAIVLDQQLNMVWPEFVPFWRLTTTPGEW